jgi:hypothetical protein
VIREAFLFDGTTVEQLTFDSSIEGGGICAARVERHACESLQAKAGEFQCIKPRSSTQLCSQSDSRIEVLGPPQLVSTLRCANSERFSDCSTASDGGFALPPSTPDLVCHHDFGALYCG